MKLFTTSVNFYLHAGKVYSTIHIPRVTPVILTMVPSGRMETEWLGGDPFKPPAPRVDFCISNNLDELAFLKEIAAQDKWPKKNATSHGDIA